VIESGFTGDVRITGILWSFNEDGGSKHHAHLVAPQLELMVELFAQHFEVVELIRYPPAFSGSTGRPAILASRKKSPPVRVP
jgi:hypothetical protein